MADEWVMETTRNIAALWESTKSAHKRVDANDAITAGIHELATNVAMMATEMKLFGERVDKNIERIEVGQKAQGERIGNIEKSIMAIERSEKILSDHEERLDNIEKAPGDKWNKLQWLIISSMATGTLGFIAANIF